MKDQRGIALVIVLWGVSLLSLLAASLAAGSGMAARRSLNTVQAAQARARLDEALAATALALERPQRPWRADGRPRHLALDGAEAEVRVQDERGRADLNHAAPPLLQALLRRAAGDTDAADRLQAALTARVTQRPLLTVAELAALPGVDARLYRRLSPLVTVHNPGGKVDWRLADPALLTAIPGLTEAQAAALVARRGDSGYSPDPAMTDAMNRAGVAALSDQGPIGDLRLVTVRISLSLSGGGRASAEILVKLAADGDPLRIVEWRSPVGDGA